MGYIVFKRQLEKIKELTDDSKIESVELLWLPGGIQLMIWTTMGAQRTYLIDEDGGTTGG